MARLVIHLESPSQMLYAQSWHKDDGSVSQVKWVEKAQASTYSSRREANQVLAWVTPELIPYIKVEPR